jgi:hypothetical protein
MDYNNINTMFGTDLQPSPFFEEFAFGCCKEAHFWDLERYEMIDGVCTPTGFPKFWAETLFTCHEAYIFIYTTLHIFVLSKIPFWYDRFEKEATQEKKDRLRLGKLKDFLQWKLI